jgi:hypothetical protein
LLLFQNVLPGSPVADENGRVREHGAARDVVGMVVAVNDVAHRFRRQLLQFRLEPSRGFDADRVRRDHAVRRHHHQRLVRFVPEEQHVLGQLRQFVGRLGFLRRHGARSQKQPDTEKARKQLC